MLERDVVDAAVRPSRRQKKFGGDVRTAALTPRRRYTNSILKWALECRIVFDKFHVMQHADAAADEVSRAEFFRGVGGCRGAVKGKRWLAAG